MDELRVERAVSVRSVGFFAEPGQVAEVERRINDDVLPRFSALPEFLGFLSSTLWKRPTGDHRHVLLAADWKAPKQSPRPSGTKSSA